MARQPSLLTPEGLRAGLSAIAERYPKFSEQVESPAGLRRTTAWFLTDCGWMTDALFMRCIERHRADGTHGAFAPDTASINRQADISLQEKMATLAADAPWAAKAASAAQRQQNRKIKPASPETVALCMAEISKTVKNAKTYRAAMQKIHRERMFKALPIVSELKYSEEATTQAGADPLPF